MLSKLRIHRAPIGISLQDAGRTGYLRYGVAPAGPIDWARHAMVNQMLDQPHQSAAIEIGPAGIGLTLESGSLRLSFAGPGFYVKLENKTLSGPVCFSLQAGQALEVVPRSAAMWSYLGIQGHLDVQPVLGSVAENSASGLCAAGLSAGSLLTIRGNINQDTTLRHYVDPYITRIGRPFGLIPSSQFDDFSVEVRESLVGTALSCTPRFDRMAYQIEGLRLKCDTGHDILSDGVTMGAIQVPGDGRPFVLMADHQTTGGYPKIGCICKVDLPRMAQMAPGKHFTLQWIRPDQALTRWLETKQQIISMEPLRGI